MNLTLSDKSEAVAIRLKWNRRDLGVMYRMLRSVPGIHAAHSRCVIRQILKSLNESRRVLS